MEFLSLWGDRGGELLAEVLLLLWWLLSCLIS